MAQIHNSFLPLPPLAIQKNLQNDLIEEPVHLIDNDGSARGPRHFIIYNPPITDEALGLRKVSLLEGVRLGTGFDYTVMFSPWCLHAPEEVSKLFCVIYKEI